MLARELGQEPAACKRSTEDGAALSGATSTMPATSPLVPRNL